MIEINSISKNFGKLTAVDKFSLNISDNECFALLGLNGAGKTTLLNILSTQIIPSSGSASIFGKDIIKDREEVRKIINISPQESAIAKNLTIKENLDLIATLYGVKNKEEVISSLIKEFQLEEKSNTIAKKLSGGQKRRLSLALSLITSPKVLFLDEPTLGLDVKARKILWNIINNLKSRMTILLTTHYLEEVEFLADRIGIISRGKLKIVGSCSQIKEKTSTTTLEDAFLQLTEEEQ